MTEAEWLACTDPRTMLASFGPSKLKLRRLPGRVLRLYACACCRRIWYLLTDERSRKAVDLAEGYAYGTVSREELVNAAREANDAFCDDLSAVAVGGSAEAGDDPGLLRSLRDAAKAAEASAKLSPAHLRSDAYATSAVAAHSAWDMEAYYGSETNPHAPLLESDNPHLRSRRAERAAQSRLLRDILGNPFRPVIISPAWQTTDVVALARAIHDAEVFERMPELADALQDAGCDNADLLDHCRQPYTHIRGCWAVDAILGR